MLPQRRGLALPLRSALALERLDEAVAGKPAHEPIGSRCALDDKDAPISPESDRVARTKADSPEERLGDHDLAVLADAASHPGSIDLGGPSRTGAHAAPWLACWAEGSGFVSALSTRASSPLHHSRPSRCSLRGRFGM